MGSFTTMLPENIGASTSNTSAIRWIWSGRILRDRGLERLLQAFSSRFQAIFSASSFRIKYKWQVWRVEFIYESQISCNKSLIGSILSLSIGFNEKRLVRACKCFFLIYIMIWKLNKESSNWGLRLYWQGHVCTYTLFFLTCIAILKWLWSYEHVLLNNWITYCHYFVMCMVLLIHGKILLISMQLSLILDAEPDSCFSQSYSHIYVLLISILCLIS